MTLKTNHQNQRCDRRTFAKAMLAGAAGFGLAAHTRGAERKTSISLGEDQSPIKHQRDRGTCYVYAVVAALEAAYNRAGIRNLDLSEEFCNNALRLFWLHPEADEILPASNRENFFSMEGGGLSNGVVEMMATCGFAVPKEHALRYCPDLPFGYTKDEHVARDVRWRSQYNVGSFNLFPGRFDSANLSNAEYYGVDTFESNIPNHPERFEEVLEAGHEIIWSFHFPSFEYPGHAGRIWDYTGPVLNEYNEPKYAGAGGHAMLIYGFDRSNPNKPFFRVKNSWGEKDTFVSYEYVRRLGKNRATSIVKVAEPRTWPELAVIGRWSLEIDGRQGVFDLYHLPGMSDTAFEAHNRIDRKTGKIEEDRRVGTFFVDGKPNDAYRVNGFVGTDGLRLNVDWSDRACSYSHRGGQPFTLRFVGNSREVMKGKLLGGDNAGAKVVARRLRHPSHFQFVS